MTNKILVQNFSGSNKFLVEKNLWPKKRFWKYYFWISEGQTFQQCTGINGLYWEFLNENLKKRKEFLDLIEDNLEIVHPLPYIWKIPTKN